MHAGATASQCCTSTFQHFETTAEQPMQCVGVVMIDHGRGAWLNAFAKEPFRNQTLMVHRVSCLVGEDPSAERPDSSTVLRTNQSKSGGIRTPAELGRGVIVELAHEGIQGITSKTREPLLARSQSCLNAQEVGQCHHDGVTEMEPFLRLEGFQYDKSTSTMRAENVRSIRI